MQVRGVQGGVTVNDQASLLRRDAVKGGRRHAGPKLSTPCTGCLGNLSNHDGSPPTLASALRPVLSGKRQPRGNGSPRPAQLDGADNRRKLIDNPEHRITGRVFQLLLCNGKYPRRPLW